MSASETDVGTAFRKVDAADQFPFGIEDRNSVQTLPAHAPTDPQVPVRVDSQTVRSPVRLSGDEGAAVRQFRSILCNVVSSDDSGSHSRFDDVKLRLVWRKCQPVRSVSMMRTRGSGYRGLGSHSARSRDE